jgi:uncharacterized membrane protein
MDDTQTEEAKNSRRIPLKWLIVLIIMCVLPTALVYLGGESLLSGNASYLILCTASFSVAFFVAILTLIQFNRTGEVSTPVLGLGMMCAGFMDLWQATAVASGDVSDTYLLLTWTFSRAFYAVVLLFAATVSPMFEKVKGEEQRKKSMHLTLFCGLLFLLLAVGFMSLFSYNSGLVERIYSGGVLQKAFTYGPILLLVIAATYVLPTFNMWHRNVFSLILIISCIPLIIAQIHFSFGVQSAYDSHLGAANLLKVFGYLIPLIGLIGDYEHTYKTIESTNRELQKKIFAVEQGSGITQQHDSFYDALMANLKSPVLFVDTSGKVTRINNQMAIMAGMGLGSKALPLLAIGRDLVHVMGDEMGPVAQKAAQHVLAENASITLPSETYTYKDGKQHAITWEFHPIHNKNKNTVAIACIAQTDFNG